MKFVQILVLAVAGGVHGYSFTSEMDSTNTRIEIGADLSVNEENRMIGGMDADLDKYPYVASVRISGLTVCVATLIAPQYLVTTAHCIKTNEFAMTASFDLEYELGKDGEEIEIVKGFKHPLYNKKKKVYDVGLLKLEKPLTKKVAALPATDGSDEKVGTIATVLGWRLTDEGTSSFQLQQAHLAIISAAECGKFKSYQSRLTKGMICAGNGNGKGSCRGDAGGPLVVNGAIVGFVSWAEGKCGKVPGVYTRVSYVLDYINDVVGGGDGKRFGPGPTSSGSSTVNDLEATTVQATKSTKTTTMQSDAPKTTTADFSSVSSANQQTTSTQGLTFAFDGSTPERKDAFTKAPNSGADSEQ